MDVSSLREGLRKTQVGIRNATLAVCKLSRYVPRHPSLTSTRDQGQGPHSSLLSSLATALVTCLFLKNGVWCSGETIVSHHQRLGDSISRECTTLGSMISHTTVEIWVSPI